MSYVKRQKEIACVKSASEKFVGGRKGFDKELLFFLLLMKKVTNWSYRDVASMGDISHSTLVWANTYFLKKNVYNWRVEIERTFSRLKRIFNLGKEETRGILSFAKQVYLGLICYMLKLFDIAGIS